MTKTAAGRVFLRDTGDAARAGTPAVNAELAELEGRQLEVLRRAWGREYAVFREGPDWYARRLWQQVKHPREEKIMRAPSAAALQEMMLQDAADGAVRYYAIVDARDRPAGVLQRILDGDNQRNVVFGMNLAWGHRDTPPDGELHQISEEEADIIVLRMLQEGASQA